jgi:hypothetical protein
MRYPAPFVLLLAAGCQDPPNDTGPEEEGAIHQRSFDLSAASLLLSEHGDVGVMAADDRVSTFDAVTGDGLAVTGPGDFTAPTVEDWVGERVAIVDRAPGGVFLWTPGEVGYEERLDEEAGGTASLARGWDGGLAWVGRRSDTCRFLRDGLPDATLKACGSLLAAAVIRGDGTLFLGRDDGVGGVGILRLDPNGAMVPLTGPIGLLDWDDQLEVLYAADPEDTVVHALTADGGPVFDLPQDGPVLDLAALDGAAALAVLAGEGNDLRVHLFDAIRGEEITSLEVAPQSRYLAASTDGATIAVAQPDRLVVFTVDWLALMSDTGA